MTILEDYDWNKEIFWEPGDGPIDTYSELEYEEVQMSASELNEKLDLLLANTRAELMELKREIDVLWEDSYSKILVNLKFKINEIRS